MYFPDMDGSEGQSGSQELLIFRRGIISIHRPPVIDVCCDQSIVILADTAPFHCPMLLTCAVANLIAVTHALRHHRPEPDLEARFAELRVDVDRDENGEEVKDPSEKKFMGLF